MDLKEALHELDEAREQLKAERTLAERLEQENANAFMRRWAKTQERAVDVERALRDEIANLVIENQILKGKLAKVERELSYVKEQV